MRLTDSRSFKGTLGAALQGLTVKAHWLGVFGFSPELRTGLGFPRNPEEPHRTHRQGHSIFTFIPPLKSLRTALVGHLQGHRLKQYDGHSFGHRSNGDSPS